MNATLKTTQATKSAQIRLSKTSPAHWRVTFDNPPLNLMGPEFVVEFGRDRDGYRERRATQGRGFRQRGRRLLSEP